RVWDYTVHRHKHSISRAQVVAEYPPSITTTSPVTNRLAVTRLTTVSATSSGVAHLPSGVLRARRAIRSSYRSASACSIHSPSSQPGATAFTRISGPRAPANVRVRLTTAALLAA